MATSGENVVRYTVNTVCSVEINFFQQFPKPCNWDGDVDVYVDSDNSAVFTCGNGHVNETTWDAIA
jgi:hypothetical protein